MRNKKIITIVLAAMLACTAVTACGKKEATDEFEKTVEVETDVVAETEEPETVESEVAAEPSRRYDILQADVRPELRYGKRSER